ncbi:acetylornithine and succinylornithine aminotransferase [Colletotrichum graminicola]|uniref:acetylornithine transaminase n=1 Tax=Colletotrichum graminicola (strain M1.001 / M2 / FGSC 10212) TaxID=645133 RepID=E3QV99_COLGM|nr:acetylornithine and succinylornithine aminotransferase [Colletotrichum graminicola M1.001]EFQ34787.1 acetylornithine and succinylornithine aminotransferase [Colletotrichum graminicola M1.001]WDK10428.1 acetylornithine and succinylornithine aminotransferase [Colletotrichum graminicola]
MAFRAPLRLQLAKCQPLLAVSSRGNARAVSSATAASSLPEDVKSSITSQASLPNPDPTEDSASAALVREHAPYMVATYARPPPVFVKGQGSVLWDIENRQYLDFTAGIAVNSLGHCDPELTKLLTEQGSTLMHASNLYYNPWTGALSKLLVEKTREAGAMHDVNSVFICNSGSEANEAAIKFARKAAKVGQASGDKYEIVSFNNAFHGRTMGSLSATHNPKYQEPFAPMLPGFKLGAFNDVAAINDVVTDKTCGVIVEPIQGEGGVTPATDEFLIALARRCREVGAVLIYDEIQCGLSRTGAFWAHAHLPKEAHPDIITTAKALGNGFPIGATIVNGNVSDKIKVGDHGTTFGGNPLACRLAHNIVSRLADPGLQKAVAAKADIFRTRFDALRERFPDLIKEVRGRGLILGLQLTQDPAPIVKAARERGLLVITAGTNTLRFVPPLTITEQQIQQGLDILEEAISVTRS